MNLGQAIAYFTREAASNLLRSWKVSLLAVLTIAVSLVLNGIFLLVGGNFQHALEAWRGESRVVIYLNPERSADRERLLAGLRGPVWVEAIEEVSAQEARDRFRSTFPSLADLLEGWQDEPLPPSLEVSIDRRKAGQENLREWLDSLQADPAITAVDDDRDWIAQLEGVTLVLRGLGIVIGLVLLGTAVFTIASIIRLTAYLYRDEISVMRLVGATEFFIRGPFYLEGLLQGAMGGVVAVGTLFAGHRLFAGRYSESPWASLITERFLSPSQLTSLLLLGAVAGLLGAVLSLRREDLGETMEPNRWDR